MTDPGADGLEEAGERLNSLLAEAGQDRLYVIETKHFVSYLSLILRWNARLNLTAIRDPEAILSRHFVECIACARALPGEIGSLLDFGSGAGFPGIPIAICRPEIEVTLAESQGKKAAFLHEVVRTLGLRVKVHGGRAEEISAAFDCVALRAVDKMESAIFVASKLVRTGGWLAAMTTDSEFETVRRAAGPEFKWLEPVRLPGGESRVLALGQK